MKLACVALQAWRLWRDHSDLSAVSDALDCHASGLTVSCIALQGMAFVAGVILMYLPEEPAFRVLCQLLDGSGQFPCPLDMPTRYSFFTWTT